MWLKLVATSLIVMGMSYTISKERIFEPLRRALGGRDTWLGYLVSCPYCASHWLAFMLVPVTGTYAVDVVVDWGWLTPLLRWFLSSILVTAIAAFLRVGFFFVDESQGLQRRRERLAEEELRERDR